VKVVVSTRKPRGMKPAWVDSFATDGCWWSVYESAGSVTKAAKGASASAGQKFIANLDKRQSNQQGMGGVPV
jgi:hypothetical protein